MPIQARTIVEDVQEALNDLRGVRYPASLLVRYINRSQRDMQTHRPDVTARLIDFSLAAGDVQELPAEAATLIDMPSHATGRKARITKSDLNKIDAIDPYWRSSGRVGEILHFMHDLRNPRTVYTYPPAAAGTQVKLLISTYPVDVPAPSGDGRLASTVNGAISVDDKWQTVLTSYVMGYAYEKDVEGAGNLEMSQSYIQRALTLLGVQLQVEKAVGPRE